MTASYRKLYAQEAWMELRAFRALADPGGARAQVGRRFDDRTGRHLGTSLPGRPAHRATVQRRELELAMGERFARMLVPAGGGEAA